jgi:hypothetical protein
MVIHLAAMRASWMALCWAATRGFQRAGLMAALRVELKVVWTVGWRAGCWVGTTVAKRAA